MYSSFQGYGKEPFTLNDNDGLHKNVVNMLQKNASNTNKIFSQNYSDISNTLLEHKNIVSNLHSNNKKYHYDDTISSLALLNHKTQKQNINQVVNSDINELKLYQNSVYITGVIACATLLIAAIFVGRK